MILSRVRLSASDPRILGALKNIRTELGLEQSFPDSVEVEAKQRIALAKLPDNSMLDIPFFTVDPEGSMDLDQAMHLERRGDGYLVRYAIACLVDLVRPGGAIDVEARNRGQTMYPPDGRVPLHPLSISEGAASLLPGEIRAAYVWTFQLDSAANVTETELSLAKVRSVRRCSYEQVQQSIDSPNSELAFSLLREIGEKRKALEILRGGASLERPDQEVHQTGNSFELVRRVPMPVEAWNAQISLMTGMEAAKIMLKGKVGILRALPAPSHESLDWFKRKAFALGFPWPTSKTYGEFVGSLDSNDPKQLALIHSAASLFRGAGYVAFSGDVPKQPNQWAVAAPYTHVTAPIRRLVDRFALEVCLSLSQGTEISEWVQSALPELPKLMAISDGISGRLDSAVISCFEAAALSGRVAESFEASVLTVNSHGGEIVIQELGITAQCVGELKLGSIVKVRLTKADIQSGSIEFEVENLSGAKAN
ncbi:MAG: RNB domain-containing ribonuclease [Microbacteriaceae bacterium]|nr:RNB domain-containing ribonuclease [Cryobacterium sp.]MBX3104291.1 RNB domain-containing ribonuclease [Cryobacterium sp.]MCC6377108.1 RNB domain-containing ribonuclease [Microbacteriaceae bacterium]